MGPTEKFVSLRATIPPEGQKELDEMISECGLPADFADRLTAEEATAWMHAAWKDKLRAVERARAEENQWGALMQYLDPLWRELGEDMLMVAVVTEARRRWPGDFLDNRTLQIPRGPRIRLPFTVNG
jgi:hypothetical protein